MQVQAHEIQKELLFDNRQTLKDLSAKFENIHASVISLFTQIVREYKSYIRETEIIIKKAKPTREKKVARMPKMPDFYARRFDVAEKLLVELYSLQGVLMLYGYKDMSSIIYEYRSNASAIFPNYKTDSAEDEFPQVETINKLNNLRTEFYQVANSYLGRQSKL
jgi:hypothetical protein